VKEIIVVSTLGLSEYLGDCSSRNYAHSIRKGLVHLFIQVFPGKDSLKGCYRPKNLLNFLKSSYKK
jgi:hypothetical protein